MEPASGISTPEGDGKLFRTTRWSQVRRACEFDTSAAEAMSQLCRNYWYPLYAFIRRRGYSAQDAEDLTQSFFTRIIQNQMLHKVRQERGRFRSFLLKSLLNFLTNEWDKQQAAKRGGQNFFVSWDELNAEGRYEQEPWHDLSPDRLYEQRWAVTLIERATEALRQEYAAAGEQEHFELLQVFLSEGRSPGSYREIATRWNVTEDTVRMRVFRLRRRFGELLRAEVADTVEDESEIDDEMQHLFNVWK